MNSLAQNPSQWRLSTLLSLETEEVRDLACWAAGTLTSFHLILGRCLLALHQSKGYKNYGCSTAVHFGASVLGVSTRVARECKRVAGKLQDLPLLTLASERGETTWSKVREVVRVASPETEEFWLKLMGKHSCRHLQKLVSKTPYGKLPGDPDVEKSCTTEFRIVATPELIRLFRRAKRMLSDSEKIPTGAETLEFLLASFFSSQPVDTEVLEKMNQDAEKDLLAERARELPEIMEARETAAEMGLLSCEGSEIEEDRSLEELLGQAVGLEQISGQDDERSSESAAHPKRPTRVISEHELYSKLAEELSRWQNTKLRFNAKQRFLTEAQKREVMRRDGWECSTPACANRGWLHIHHIVPYSEGGETTKENSLTLCSSCHRNLHDGTLRITPTASGKLIFTDANGRRLDHQADLELAGWLDYWSGWRGTEHDSHKHRLANGDWAVFSS